MNLSVAIPQQYEPLIKEMMQAEYFEETREGLSALVRAAVKDHAQTLANNSLEKGKYTAAQNLVKEVNQVNQELFPPATARATQLVFVNRSKKGQTAWVVKQMYSHRGSFYETINPDGTPGKAGSQEKGSLMEAMACELLV